MYLKEIWRYPVKSMRGEQLPEALVSALGIEHDREIVVVSSNGRAVTSRTQPRLLGLQGGVNTSGDATVNGQGWQSEAAGRLVKEAAGNGASLVRITDARRFDVLPLLVLTDGAIAALGEDPRRLRPNLVIGGVEGLSERTWEGRKLRIGEVEVFCAQLRGRCVMTTYDPDTLVQDRSVLGKIVRDFDGRFALDTEVLQPGTVRVGDEVMLL
ncbi:MAG: MOSC domain-containing protein [Terriglobales bacterium]